MKRVGANQKSLVVDILTKSFDDNKSVNYVVKQDKKRVSRIRGLMDYSFDVCDAFGDVWMTEDEQACALVLYPDKKKSSIRSILWDVKLATSVIGLSRIGKVLGREAKINALHPKDSFSYLWFIGVAPGNQNRGRGSRLLEEIVHDSEMKRRPVYLETSVDRNLPWYKKYGFEVFQTLDVGYSLYMLRRRVATNGPALNSLELEQATHD
jgi:ribosomal protein S18 acetylase RimI-like enzyme